MNREKFEQRLCDLINKQQKTHFKPCDFEGKIDGIFCILDEYNERYDRITNIGKPVNFKNMTYKELRSYAKACIESVKERKMKPVLAK